MLKDVCEICELNPKSGLKKLGVQLGKSDYTVALAGNPNTGKSTVFNALTGLRQHTGNWPGKTVVQAEGNFSYQDKRFKLVDLPGTYSLLSDSDDEEVARDFILFGKPDVTVIVVDAGRLERNLSLVLQILQITPKVVLCLNLMDEAERHNIKIDHRTLARELHIPVIPTTARNKKGLDNLLQAIAQVANGSFSNQPPKIKGLSKETNDTIEKIVVKLNHYDPELQSKQWVALRLLENDQSIITGLKEGKLSSQLGEPEVCDILKLADISRQNIDSRIYDDLTGAVYSRIHDLLKDTVKKGNDPQTFRIDRTIDNIVTGKTWGFPVMLLLLGIVLWLTITGANYPSQLLSDLLLGTIHPLLKDAAGFLHFPLWLSGLLIDGMYLSTAWVVSVMLPPMAIFFPLFTLLEDFGYLPRVAFNLDFLFKKAGAHGKQALTMSMGFGCNAAGVIATRIINSPREKLIAIITNNFSLCNGRWPTQILIAGIFIGALVPSRLSHTVSTLAVVGIVLLGIAFTFLTSWFLSKTLLKGESSFFVLELPPYRPPQILKTIYTSLIDRTLIVLWRAVVFAMPAGAIIWLICNIDISSQSIAVWLIDGLDPIALVIGLNGVILLAYVLAIPANEIVIPTILMLTTLVIGNSAIGSGAGVLFEGSDAEIASILHAGGWTLLTGINLMLFSLLHNPCSTTIYTIYKETGSIKWTFVASILPLILGLVVCFITTQLWDLF
jgi:ferrous iron transport protein B